MFSATAKDTIGNASSDTKIGSARVKSEDMRHGANDMRHDFESTANNAGRKIREYFDTASDEITHAADTVTTQIRTKPIQSSMVALGVGFILGALFRR